MTQKPKIQYVGMFYVHGSEAKKLQEQQRRREARNALPLQRLRKIEAIYIDPVAIFSIVVALIMLVTMVIGMVQIVQDWEAYQVMSSYVSELNEENARLAQDYRNGLDLEHIRKEALALGMIPKENAPSRTVTFTIAEPAPEPTRMDHIRQFLAGLFE